jgi:predicted nucleotidyltransferase
MPAFTVPDLCRLAVAASADREASYVKDPPQTFGRYTRWYAECVDRVLARERRTVTPTEHQLIYILAAYGEACDYARAHLATLTPA